MSYIYIVNYKDMRTTRLNERDLTRIVRRVLREEEAMGGGTPKKDCFSNTTISIPSSCKVKPKSDSIAGNGISIGKNCVSDLGSMITMQNLREVTKVLSCVSKIVGTGALGTLGIVR
jgi:hypothetical protein